MSATVGVSPVGSVAAPAPAATVSGTGTGAGAAANSTPALDNVAAARNNDAPRMRDGNPAFVDLTGSVDRGASTPVVLSRPGNADADLSAPNANTDAGTSTVVSDSNASTGTERRNSRSQSQSQPRSQSWSQSQSQSPTQTRPPAHVSHSIHAHADAFMQLIHEQRVLTAQASLAEIASLRIQLEERSREVGYLVAEVESFRGRRLASSSVSGASASASASSSAFAFASAPSSSSLSAPVPPMASLHPPNPTQDLRYLQYELENRRREVEVLRAAVEEGKTAKGEVAVLKCTVDALTGEYRKTRAEVEMLRREREREGNNKPSYSSRNGVKEEQVETDLNDFGPSVDVRVVQAEMDALRGRCEDLERENERLRKSEGFLRQRVEILESLNASTSSSLQPLDNLPDLSNALQAFLGQSPNTYATGPTEAHAKKRRLDRMHGG